MQFGLHTSVSSFANYHISLLLYIKCQIFSTLSLYLCFCRPEIVTTHNFPGFSFTAILKKQEQTYRGNHYGHLHRDPNWFPGDWRTSLDRSPSDTTPVTINPNKLPRYCQWVPRPRVLDELPTSIRLAPDELPHTESFIKEMLGPEHHPNFTF